MPTTPALPAVFGRARFALVLVGLASLTATPALAQSARLERGDAVVDITANGEQVKVGGATVNVTGKAASVRAAGADVTVRGEVSNDVGAAGALVDIDVDAGRDISSVGASVGVRGQAGRNVNAGGAVLTINAVIGGNLKAGGAVLTVGPGSDIAGSFEGGAANLRVGGHIAGPVNVGGALVTFNARTDGSVEINGGKVVIGAPARIGGDLIVRSMNDPEIDPAAEIGGQVRRIAPPQWWWPLSPWAQAALFAGFVAVGTIVTGIILMLFGGRVLATATDHVRLRPGSSLLLGLATAVLIPVIAAIVMATVVGFSAGIAVLLLLPVLAVFGHAVAAAGIASGIFVRDRGVLGPVRTFLLLVVGAIIVALVWLIPWVGGFLGAIILLFGIGALTRTLGARIRRSEPAPAV
jgi:hypothetical protein